MKILVTGFEPFGGESINPSREAVMRADAPAGAEIIRRTLPVTWKGGKEALLSLIGETEPDIVLMTGQAGGRKGVTIERIGVNCMEASIPDNDGVKMCGEAIFPGAPDGLFSTFDYRAVKKALDDGGIDASFSFSAGAFICNLVLYTALHTAQTAKKPFRAGFIHLPYLPEQAHDALPSLTLDEQTRAVSLALSALAKEA